MNPYDLSLPEGSLPKTYGYRAGLGVWRRVRAGQALTILWGIVLIWAILARPEPLSDSPTGYALLFFPTLICLWLLIGAGTQISARKMSRMGNQAGHDYNLALYRRVYAKNPASRSQLLVSMARQSLLLGETERARLALEQIVPERLNARLLKTYYLLQAAVQYLQGQPWRQWLDSCHAILQPDASLSREELEALFSCGPSQEALLAGLERWSIRPPIRLPLVQIGAGLLILCTGWYCGAELLLPSGWNYRTPFQMGATAALWLGWLLLALWLFLRLGRAVRRNPDLSRLNRAVLTGLLGLVYCCLLLVGGISWLANAISLDSEVEELEGGLLLMRSEASYDESDYYYNYAVGPLLRHELTENEEAALADETEETDTTEADTTETEESGQETADDSALLPDTVAVAEAETEADTEDARLRSEALAIYQTLYDAGEVETADTDAVTFSYTAKGSFYAVFSSGEDEEGSWTTRLVYDRESENGLCDLFVYYIDRTDETGATTTGILEFYAVNRQTTEVIPGEKTAWSQVASQAYREATGE